MIKIEWDELITGYNRKAGTDFDDSKSLLEHLWHTIGSITAVADRLGVSRGGVKSEMGRCHIKYLSQDMMCMTPYSRIEAIPYCRRKGMTLSEIARLAKCSRSSVVNFMRNIETR